MVIVPGSGPEDDALEFQLLGPLRLICAGQVATIGSPKQRSLLAALIVNRGQVIPTDRLCHMVWGDAIPKEPERSLHTHISRLRSRLEAMAGTAGSEPLVTRAPGYVLQADRERIDIHRFEDLLREAQASPDPRLARDRLDQALALWRGPALAEFEQEFARAEARRLDELRMVAVEERIDAVLALGGHAGAVPELDRLVRDHPLRERLRAQWMLALYRCGRQADALAGYRRFRDELDVELGLEPSEPLRRLERDILQQSDHLAWRAGASLDPRSSRGESSSPADPAAEAAGHVHPLERLPAELTSFVGREGEASELATALETGRLITLTGPGGVGKTRLAVRAARAAAPAFTDGVRFCDLSTVNDPGAVASAVATALGARARSGGPPEDALTDLLRAKRALLILDNGEHVVEAAAALTSHLLQACPRLTVLTTSRRPLTISGEQLWTVEPLPVSSDTGEAASGDLSPAVQLFYDRASLLRPDMHPTPDTLPSVTEICRQLDGLPLAIELAAARSRSLTPADIAARLGDRFALLIGGDRSASDRHRTLRAVVDWSYDLLDPPAAALLDRLTVFAGSFSLESVEKVCEGSSAHVADLLAELVDHSLLVADQRAHHVRYRLLESLRQYGRQRLEARDEAARWQRAHALHMADLTEGLASETRSGGQLSAVRRLDHELANLREAVRFGLATQDVDLAVRLTVSLYDYAVIRLHDEVFRWAEGVHETARAADHPRFAELCGVAAMGCSIRGELQRAERLAHEGLEAAPATGDPRRARPLSVLADVALYRGELEELQRTCEEESDIAHGRNDTFALAICNLRLALACEYAGTHDQALAHLTRLGEFAEACRSPTALGWHRYARGELLRDTDPEEAAASFREAIELVAPLGDRFIAGVARVSLASLQAAHGEYGRALRSFREVIAHWHEAGDWTHQWTTLRNLVALFARIGAAEPAAVLRAAILAADTAAPVYGSDADRLATLGSSLRADLGAEVFAAADARGAVLGDAEAVDHALAQIDRLLAGVEMDRLPRGELRG